MTEALAVTMTATSVLPRIPVALSAGLSLGSAGIALLLLSIAAIGVTRARHGG